MDADHDALDGGSCSANYGGAGWWFSDCGYSLNGRWGAGGAQGLVWDPVTGPGSAASSRMMVGMAVSLVFLSFFFVSFFFFLMFCFLFLSFNIKLFAFN